MSRDNVEAVLHAYEAMSRGDIDAAVAGFDPDIEWQVPPFLTEGTVHRGVAAVRRLWETWTDSFERVEWRVEEVIDAGDEDVMVMAALHATGRGSGAEVVSPTFAQIWTVRDGRAVRVEMLPNRRTALERLGLPDDPC
jgi:ketosteroid isomerase-like protein